MAKRDSIEKNIFTSLGTISNRDYVFWGIILFGIKYLMDRIVALAVFDRSWFLWNYLEPANGGLKTLGRNDFPFFATLVILALPFIWLGTMLTLRRLRDAALPGWLVVCFFLPVVNLFFFVILSILPSRGGVSVRDGVSSGGALDRWMPKTRLGSAILAVILNVISGLLLTKFSVSTLKQYGWGLFVGLPFCLGLTSSLIYSYRQRRSWGECVTVSMVSLCFIFLMLILFAFEGVICLLMAGPIAAVLTLIGATIGYAIQFHHSTREELPKMYSLMLLLVPALMGGDKYASPPSTEYEVKTAIVVNATPGVVWKNVVSFSELPPPQEWYFRAGIAYPMRAKIEGSGVGAVRHCEFSTGEFTEPVRIWEEPRRLMFSVTHNPAPMEEYTLYEHLSPPHLTNFLVSHGGQFLLRPIAGNKTRLEGTTWYQHHLWPEAYWKLWSDYLIHHIHLRVLNHIKTNSEKFQISDLRFQNSEFCSG